MLIKTKGRNSRAAVFVWIGVAYLFAPALGLAQGYTITTVAGGGNNPPQNGGPATGASLWNSGYSPYGVAVDQTGNFYVSDATTLVYKVSKSGNISVFAGIPNRPGYSGDGAPATSAQLGNPTGLAVDSTGNVYIAEAANKRIRKVDTNGIITTVAGGGSPASGSGDGGPATLALLDAPRGIAVDSAGSLYIAEAYDVRKVASDGTITTFAGTGAPIGGLDEGGPATKAEIYPSFVALDSFGNLYIADSVDNLIRKVSNGIITTVAGSGSGSYSGDGGPATSAGISGPGGIALDPSGNLYISDNGDDRIRMVTPGGTITTIAGNGIAAYSGDNGPATTASLNMPIGLAVTTSGRIYVADPGNAVVRLLTPTIPSSNAPPSIKSGGIVSASAFGQFPAIAPGSWIEIYGSNLATGTRSWAASDFSGNNAPTSLDGTTVNIGGQSAFIDYISPGQVNAQVPSNISTGQQSLVVTAATGSSSPYMITVNATEPGLLAPASFNVGGKQYVAAVFSDGVTYALPPGAVAGVPSKRAQPGDNLLLYGIGFGSVAPNIPAGQVVQQGNSLTLPINLMFGQTQAQVTYDGLAPNAIGLYQFNVVVPSVAANDATLLSFSLNGIPGAQQLYIAVQ